MKHLKMTWPLAVMAACGASEPKLPSIRASYTAYDKVGVTWNAVDAAFTNLVVDVMFAGPPPLISQSVPPGALAVTVDLTVTLPTITASELQVRLTGEAGGKRYSSDVVTVKRSAYQSILHCDSDRLSFCTAGSTGFHLYWAKESAANRYILTRRIFLADFSFTDTAIADVRGDGPFEVHDSETAAWTDGATYEYRLVGYVDDDPGRASWVVSLTAPLNAPVVSGASTTDGVVLTIGNRSSYGAGIEVYRKTPTDEYSDLIADTPGPANWTEARFLDPGVPPGAYLYQVLVATGPLYASSTIRSVPVPQWVVVSASGPGTLSASKVDLVPGIFAARAPSGSFAVVSNLLRFDQTQTAQVGNAIVPDATNASHALILPDPRSVSRVAVDSSGQAHALYVDDADRLDSSPVPIVHTWFDGQSWQSEDVATELTAQNRTAFDIGVEGTLHAAWLGPFRNGAFVVGVATRSGSTWQIDDAINDVPAVRSAQWRKVYVAGDETGAPHLLLTNGDVSDFVMHFFRDQAGQWQSESIPDPLYFQMPLALLAGGGRVTLVTQLLNGIDRRLVVFERTASGWSDAIPLATDGSLPYVARSADGRRVAIADPYHRYDQQHSGTLWIREPDGTTTTYGMPTSPAALSTGFSADGKAWVLQWLEDGSNWPPGPPAPAILLEER